MQIWQKFKMRFGVLRRGLRLKASGEQPVSRAHYPKAGTGGGWSSRLAGSDRDWKTEAGDLTTNSAISILLNFVCNTFADARFVVKHEASDGTISNLVAHPVARLLKRPNPRWTRTQLLTALLLSRFLDGNAYLYKARSLAGKVVELWWLPHTMVEVVTNDDGEVTGYKYKVGNRETVYAPEDVIHLKSGVDLSNPAKGVSPLRALLREVCTDNELQVYTYAILKNLGINGPIITPKDDTTDIDEELATDIKTKWISKTTGDSRGEPLILTEPFDITNPAFKPNELMLDKIAELSEARLAGAFGVPSVVVQFIVGLRNANAKASFEESIQQLYGCCIKPLQREVCEWLDLQLLPELGDENSEYCAFDNSEITALQEDVNALHKRADDGYTSGVLKRSDARKMKGYEAGPEDEIYLTDLTAPAFPSFEEPGQTNDEESKELRRRITRFWQRRANQPL